MDSGDQFENAEKLVVCRNCGHPVIQSDVDENGGECTYCNKKFEPFNIS